VSEEWVSDTPRELYSDLYPNAEKRRSEVALVRNLFIAVTVGLEP